MSAPTDLLSRTDASAAVADAGWRFLLGALAASVPVPSLTDAVDVARTAVQACGADADAHLRADLRPDRVELLLQTRALGAVTTRDADLARAVTHALGGPAVLAAPSGPARPVQALEIAVDALDIARVRPFWAAVLGYVAEPHPDGPSADSLVDPAGQLPAVWFQQMDTPRPQRNRIHLDLTVAHDEAPARVQAALDAGGRLLDDSAARSFWVLADAEGNEVCVCTWQDRDERAAAG
ncbi:4a-hydroxytetrahydrobiopterin dehydratase [Modestobacter sp. I12A-02628]|uniref:4a-hydroxytetrahydrobiopterin dehydratase n=1 Tax=Goekera deserti TaxID=2497753 RepID=A0A7K3W8V6_9ACTN|nr:VOC family protein [Goekera deserti]MPR00443.1 4a-hydroxytetrahydrobiopterin dehydratase [Goekera deserti]NDI49160.1 4a-hydroxytetrahydrobiopterin dehydratase [Goekera deserti]NEL52898.1 4a-hydroxytetrahydrobiopterin dehydratase [Goekera deserti]